MAFVAGSVSGMFGAAQRLLARLLPLAIFLPGFFVPAPSVVAVTNLPIDPKFLVKNVRSGRKIEIQVAQSACLTRSVTLPRAAVVQADAAIALQMRQTLPGSGNGLVWQWLQVAGKEATVEFQVFILKQAQIDGVIAACETVGAALVSIGISDVHAPPLWMQRSNAAGQRKFWLLLTLLAGLLPAVWTIFDAEQQLSTVEAANEATQSRVTDLKNRLIAARDAANTAETEAATLQQDLAVFAAHTGRLAELAGITDVLPDAVWISEMTITDDRLSVSGFTGGEVSETISKLRRLPWVDAVQLEGPVSLDTQTGQSRFQLSLRIKTTRARP